MNRPVQGTCSDSALFILYSRQDYITVRISYSAMLTLEAGRDDHTMCKAKVAQCVEGR